MLYTFMKSPYMAAMSPLLSIDTIFVVIPAPSANISFQFVQAMEWFKELYWTPDLQLFASMGTGPTVQYTLSALASWQQSFKVLIVVLLVCCNDCCRSLLTHRVRGVHLTTRDAFHGYFWQPFTISHFSINIKITRPLASRLLKELAVSIGISGTSPPLSEHATSLAVIQVPCRGIPDGLPGLLPASVLTLGLQSQQSIALQVDARISGLLSTQYLSVSSSQCVYCSWHHVYK